MESLGKKPVKDLTGQIFGSLTVIGPAERRQGDKPRWLALCVCGTMTKPLGCSIKSGQTRSCGCQRGSPGRPRSHGLSRTRAYAIWKAAKQRCFDPSAENFKHYGGRGITMASEWAEDFAVFYADMGECPDGHTLEREDINKGYEPGNCRWATWADQSRNHSRNVFVDLGGVRIILKDYAKLRGVSHSRLGARVRAGEDPHAAADAMIEHRRRRQSSAAEA